MAHIASNQIFIVQWHRRDPERNEARGLVGSRIS